MKVIGACACLPVVFNLSLDNFWTSEVGLWLAHCSIQHRVHSCFAPFQQCKAFGGTGCSWTPLSSTELSFRSRLAASASAPQNLKMHPCKILAMVQNHENNFPLSGSSFGTAIFIEQLFIILRQVSHPGQRATALFARCSASRQCKDVWCGKGICKDVWCGTAQMAHKSCLQVYCLLVHFNTTYWEWALETSFDENWAIRKPWLFRV